ncbi:ZIP zinc transporter-domain-containing protein [Lophiotrema nucula]|uniref:ZIP zinc transporter-domain-containing protein n=1 Tax=Lophiotrema nucula TaxID=690887 RepID=A0A6A5YIX3_9PLEO|nr:ZIP zinc transporter-domain-containing protein [Lophiotrema nucula]
MWDGLFTLLTLSIIMAIASFLAGALPLSFSLSQQQLRIITFLGTGVLVGTSLIVIIPEGIETMYSAAGKGHSHATQKAQLSAVSSQQKGMKPPGSDFRPLARSEPALLVNDEVRHIIVRRTSDDKKTKEKDKADKLKEQQHEEAKDQAQKGGDDDSTEGHREGHTRVHAPEDEEEEKPEAHDETPEPHAYIGVALIMGFILMFLVDHMPNALASKRPQYKPLHISLSDLSRGPHNASTATLNGLAPSHPSSPPPEAEPSPGPRSSATTIGLIIHACADGIALGASSTAPATSLSLVIFFAIMLHKAPAAFGLTSVLLKQGFSKRTARTHLLMFSLAAPAGAVATWAIVHALGRARLGGEDGLTFTTGWVLLFSGGTFLYVAMHSMNEATSAPHSIEEPHANGYTDYKINAGLSKSDISIFLVGMLLPLLTQVGHVH